jgi:hypothetical protein
MFKKIVIILAAAMFLAAAAAQVSAQGVLMNSAETINQGNIKLAIFPTVLLGKNGGNSVWGVAGRIGYGLTPSLDIEAKAAYFKGLNYYGADIEYWFLKGHNLNASIALGGHLMNYDYGGLMLAFESVKNSDSNYTRAHFVPGIEYRLSADLDFLAEFGIALNDNSRNYASLGLAFYLMR